MRWVVELVESCSQPIYGHTVAVNFMGVGSDSG